jgi:hypothetical protein
MSNIQTYIVGIVGLVSICLGCYTAGKNSNAYKLLNAQQALTNCQSK